MVEILEIKTGANNIAFVSPEGREIKAMLNETYGCRCYIMELPFFEVEVFCKPGRVCLVPDVWEVGFLISFSVGA